MDALLIIDMQCGSFSSVERFNAAGVVENINALSLFFRKLNKPVLFIQHDGERENFLHHGSPEWEILPALVRSAHDRIIEKTANDSFYKTDLDEYLKSRGIDTLYVCGCATDFCVNATIHSALVKDYNIVAVSDCHTTADRPGLKAAQLIEFHNWLWANLTPTDGTISVRTLSDICAAKQSDIRLEYLTEVSSDFAALTKMLDEEFSGQNGKLHAKYAQYNGLDGIKDIIIAHAEEMAVGCCSMKKHEEGIYEIKRVFVTKEFRQRGIAARMIARLETIAREKHIHSLILETGRALLPAIKLYTSLGYSQTDNYGQYQGMKESVCMKKTLRNDALHFSGRS